MKLKNIIKEHSLGELPSSKLIKMKWNPLTEKGPVREQESPGENDIMGITRVGLMMATSVFAIYTFVMSFIANRSK